MGRRRRRRRRRDARAARPVSSARAATGRRRGARRARANDSRGCGRWRRGDDFGSSRRRSKRLCGLGARRRDSPGVGARGVRGVARRDRRGKRRGRREERAPGPGRSRARSRVQRVRSSAPPPDAGFAGVRVAERYRSRRGSIAPRRRLRRSRRVDRDLPRDSFRGAPKASEGLGARGVGRVRGRFRRRVVRDFFPRLARRVFQAAPGMRGRVRRRGGVPREPSSRDAPRVVRPRGSRARRADAIVRARFPRGRGGFDARRRRF